MEENKILELRERYNTLNEELDTLQKRIEEITDEITMIQMVLLEV